MPAPASRTPEGTHVRARGDDWIIRLSTLHEDCESIRLQGTGQANIGLTRTLLRPFDRLEPLASGHRIRVVSRREWLHRCVRAVLGTHPFGGLRTVADAQIDVLPFQLAPALAALRHARLRMLIADDVGLGKTIQAGIILGELAASLEECRALVITPAGLRTQWRAELRSRFRLDATLADTAWLLECDRTLPRTLNPWSLPGVFVTSLDLVKRPEVLRALEQVAWDAVVVDEVHAVTPGTARLAAVRAITRRSRRIVLLTATPPDAEPERLSAICELGRAHGEPPVTVFRRTRAELGLGGRRRSRLLPVTPSADETAMHRALERYADAVWREAHLRGDDRARLAAVILRKRALSSATALAITARRRLELLGRGLATPEAQLLLPLADEDVLDDMPSDTALAAVGLADVPRERALLETVIAAADRAATRETKLEALLRLLRRVSEPVIVFTEYRDTLARIAAALPASEPCLTLHGGLSPRERDDVQRRFTGGGSLLLATDAASEGLNLHHRCRLVVHYELPWMPARLEQRTGRVDRLGQPRPVHEILLVARDTAERLVLAPLMRRIRTAAAHTGCPRPLPTESAVAASIMDGTDVAALPSSVTAATRSMDLRQECDIEAQRIASLRRLGRPGGQATVPRVDRTTVVHLPKPRCHLMALTLITMRDAGDRVQHAQLVPLLLRLDTAVDRRPARRVSFQVGGLLAAGREQIDSAVRQEAARDIETARRLFEELVGALLDRESFLADVLRRDRGAVQAGLFDWRAHARADRWPHPSPEPADERIEERPRVLAEGPLHLDVQVIALRS